MQDKRAAQAQCAQGMSLSAQWNKRNAIHTHTQHHTYIDNTYSIALVSRSNTGPHIMHPSSDSKSSRRRKNYKHEPRRLGTDIDQTLNRFWSLPQCARHHSSFQHSLQPPWPTPLRDCRAPCSQLFPRDPRASACPAEVSETAVQP